jgi:threonine aldolase
MSKDEVAAPRQRLQFSSDNAAGICPEAWSALDAANRGHAPAYGEDGWTERACNLLREIFEIDCQVFFVYNGTAANSISLAAMCESYHSIICHQEAHLETDECGGICHQEAHLETDECGGPEFFSNGTKVLLVGGEDGKIDLDRVRHTVERRTDVHYPKPRVLSITQATEMGTVYGAAELDAVSETARRLGLRLHMDGARFANAVATLGVSPKEITWKVGVEVLCFGGTKNGMPVGDAIVFFDRELARDFAYRCKQAGQLHSKMRFIAAPWVGLLESGAWLEHARHANACALRLESGLRDVEGVEILAPTQANAVFAQLPGVVLEGLRERGWQFYTFIGAGGARFMCSWQTADDDIAGLLGDVRELSPGER